MLGIPATSDGETGMIPLASMGTLAFAGQRLQFVSKSHRIVSRSFSPVDVGAAWIERKVKPTFTISKDTYVHWNKSAEAQRTLRSGHTHQALVSQSGTALHVEGHSHIVLVVGCIEARNVQQRIS